MKKAPISVMLLSNSFSAGGAERFAAVLLKGLSRELVKPRLVLLRPEMTYELPDDTAVDILGYGQPVDLPGALRRLRRIIRWVKPDVIVGAGTSVNVIIGLALITMGQGPRWVAAVDTNLKRRDLRLRRMVLNLLHSRADAIVAVSRGMYRQLSSARQRWAAKVVQIYNPVDFEHIEAMSRQAPHWQRPPQVPLVVTVGRAHPVKRWDILLEAFARVVQTHPAALALCGDGPDLNALKSRARQLGISGRTHFLGRCDNPFAVTAQADLFVLCSQAEGLGYALIEAQGLGICAISTRCDFGPGEIVSHGRTGLLVDVNDADRLAAAIERLLSDAPFRTRMAAEARRQVRARFDMAACCKAWEELLLNCAHGR